jgi:hypothetical protein
MISVGVRRRKREKAESEQKNNKKYIFGFSHEMGGERTSTCKKRTE